MDKLNITKEEVLRRWNQALDHKRQWEMEFQARYAGVSDIYAVV